MRPIWKKAVAAVAAKKAYDLFAERRQPKRSRASRVVPIVVGVGAVGGAVAYLARSGRLGPIVGRLKSVGGSGDLSGTSGDTEYRPQSRPIGAPVS